MSGGGDGVSLLTPESLNFGRVSLCQPSGTNVYSGAFEIID